jgi:alcohol dehydrogenase (cytochrome c)
VNNYRFISSFLTIVSGFASAQAQTPVTTAPTLFTARQMAVGRQIYGGQCAACHGVDLAGAAAPALKGAHFLEFWADGSKTVADLRYIIRTTMPFGAPHSLGDEQYDSVVAYILSENGYRPGSEPLNSSNAATVLMSAGIPAEARKDQSLPAAPLTVERAVTGKPDDEDLAKPDDSAWLMYNKDFTGSRYSTLNQITAATARNLSPSCMFQVGEIGTFQSSPVVYDRMMYITTAYKTVAIDATTCFKIWEHDYPSDMSPSHHTSRGVAIYRGKVMRVTPNGHLLALDAKSGKPLWDARISDSTRGYFLSAAPIAYDGRVFIGTAGAENGLKAYIYAFAAETGRQIWSFNVIPTGKEAGAETWETGSEHGGGALWSTFSFDQSKGILFAPIGNPAPDFDGARRPGANLYTNSVVALDYRTGKLAWYVQQVPHDTHDWDTAAAPAIYEQGGKSFMAVANKGGWLYLYDRDTHSLIVRSEVTAHENSDVPLSAQGVHHCPGLLGGVQWNGPAYSPRDELVYVNSIHWCTTTHLTESHFIRGLTYLGGEFSWDPVETAGGSTNAFDAATGKQVWARASGTPMLAALTPTAGGVIFTGDLEGNFLTLDSRAGTVLYRFNTGGAVAGAASTYMIDGRQYVAITAGNASRSIWKTTGAATVVVFALAGK